MMPLITQTDSQKKNANKHTVICHADKLKYSAVHIRAEDEKMSVFCRIRKEIPSGTVLKTPVRKSEFRIGYEKDKMVFFEDDMEKPFSKTPRACWDGLPDFLRNQGWVKICVKFDVAPH